MKMLEKHSSVQSLVTRIAPNDCAKLAGEILGEVGDPTKEHLLMFWQSVPENFRNELAARLGTDAAFALDEEDDDDEDEDDEGDGDEKDDDENPD